MKKVFTLLVGTLLIVQGFAQSPKMVMVEEGTQASCPPCATQNPGFDALLDANASKVVVLKYQTSWPGFDQMNLDNPTEVADRVAYYGFQGVPSGFVNGVEIADDCSFYAGAPACLDQAEIDAANTATSNFDLDISGAMENGTLTITGTLTATAATTGDLKLRIALTEKSISSTDAPGGTNGETEFHHVLKKFIPGSAGISLSNSWAVGDTYTINETLSIGTVAVYQYAEMEIVAFVQDDANKSILQAAKDDMVDITVSAQNNVAAASVSVPTDICSGEQDLSPVVTIQNGGNATLTSADIVYSINGGADQTYPWMGSISTLATEEVTLDPYTFTAAATNTVNVSVQNPNGATDEDNSDDSAQASMALAIEATGTVTFEITTDPWGCEIYWEFINSSGAVVASGGNPAAQAGGGAIYAANGGCSGQPGYADGSTVTETFTIATDDCYEFNIVDDYGDGLTAGGYSLTDQLGNTIISEGVGGFERRITPIDGKFLVAVEEIEAAEAWNIFPNPAQDMVYLDFTLTEQLPLQVDLYNTLGKKVQTIASESFGAGTHSLNANVSDLPNGMYYINVVSGNQTTTHKFVVSK